MAVHTRDRADAMRGRVMRTAGGLGIQDTSLLEGAFDRAMAPRFARLDDDHDPRFLHPGRTALILMDDGGLVDPRALATAILVETECPELAADTPGDRDDSDALEAAVRAARAIPPMADEDTLAEALLTAPEPAPLIALAEYLDQLRHLRLWADPARIRARGETAARVLVPVATRVNAVLARRLAWWVRRVARR